MRQGRLQTGLLVFGIGLAANAVAQDNTRDSLLPAFKLQKNANLLDPHLSSTLDGDVSARSKTQAGPEAKLRSYDAIFYYPLHTRGVSIDLGVNLRLQEDPSTLANQPSSFVRDWLNIDPDETRTLVHAAAVFDLPFSGFKAGVSGTYSPHLGISEYDYRAKLSYKWKNGLGLEGGWQHQQKALEQQNLYDTLDVQTLFLDMNYRF